MLAENSLQGKVAIVTGGGTGIGLAIAKRFGALGATLVIGSRNARNLERGSADLRLAGYDSLAVQIDVRKIDQVDEMVHRVLHHYGRIDILVNNAAANGDGPWGAVFGTSVAKWIWLAAVPSSTADKPNVETTYARRTFYFSTDGTTVINQPACP